MSEIRIVAITLDGRGTRVEFDRPIKPYFDHIPGGQWHKKSMTAMFFPWQFDPEDVFDKIINQSRKKVKDLIVHTDMVIVTRRSFYSRLHQNPKRWLATAYFKVKTIKTTVEYAKRKARKVS